MEPNNIEKEFRKKLNAREIAPSDAAWDRLDAMLSFTENKKPKRNFTWLYVAATLTVFFAIGLFLFRRDSQQNQLVPNTNDSMVIIEPSSKEENRLKDSNTIVTPSQVHKNVKRNVVAEHQRQAEKKSISKPLAPLEVLSPQIANEERIAITAVTGSEPGTINVTAEQLLAEVTKATEKPKVKVNPNSLLSSVEDELNVAFRETTLDKIKKNFKTVKTAVANRNYE